MSDIGVIEAISRASEKTALLSPEGTVTYSELALSARSVATRLLDGRSDLEEDRVAFLVSPGIDFASLQWGIWTAGGVAVPLCTTHPRGELEHVITDSDSSVLIASDEYRERLLPIADDLGIPLNRSEDLVGQPESGQGFPTIDEDRRALIVYTSGSTGKPKGVVWTHRSYRAQLETLSEAWGWQRDDRTLLVLPLHHVHGLVNVLGCALWNSATCEVLPRFDAAAVWDRLASGELTVFMAVPTIYHRLIEMWEGFSPERQKQASAGASALRLMISGSAALPVATLEKWRSITGHTLLERYGMTEIGMGLSNPLNGERVPGSVGRPLPGVQVQLVDESGETVASGAPGELEVQGPSVFSEYWNQPDATEKAFRNGWFRTGDMAVEENGRYRILGRQSVDIIKTGGEKVSALEIEGVLRTHPDITDCAVIGIPNEAWGDEVVAVVVTDNTELSIDAVRDFARDLLAPYKLPRQLIHVEDLPRNALGKTLKPELQTMVTKA